MNSVHLAASRTFPATVEHAFDMVLTMPLPELFRHRYGPLPPIRSAEDFTEPWGTVGQTRRITLSDGGTMLEALTTSSAAGLRLPHRAAITGALKPLVTSIEGAWSFEPPALGYASSGPGTSSPPQRWPAT